MSQGWSNSSNHLSSSIALLASSLTYVPFLGEYAEGVALVAGVVALAADVGDCAASKLGVKHSECNYKLIAADALAAIPGGGAFMISRVEKSLTEVSNIASGTSKSSVAIKAALTNPLVKAIAKDPNRTALLKFGLGQTSTALTAGGLSIGIAASVRK